MSCCIKMRVREDRLDPTKPTNIDEYYFDLPIDFDIQETKQITELTVTDKLKFDYTLGFDLPRSDKNLKLLKHFINPNVFNNKFEDIPVIIEIDSTIITDSSIYVLSGDALTFNIQLNLGFDHWARNAGSLLLSDLPYNTVTHGKTHIKDVVENQYPYSATLDINDPNNLGIWYPLATYGRLKDDFRTNVAGRHIIPAEYWRPWYYVTDLLKKGFCELGFGFSSPLFDSEFGRRLMMYLIDKTYGQENPVVLNAEAEIDESYFVGFPFRASRLGTIRFPDIITDNSSGFIDPVRGLYVGVGEYNISGSVIIEVGKEDNVKIGLARMDYRDGEFIDNPIAFIDILEQDAIEGEFEYKFEANNVSLNGLEGVGLVIQKGDSATLITAKVGGSITFEGVRTYAKEGDQQNLQNILTSDVSFMELLKGLSHTFNLRIKTDFVNRVVELYIPFKRTISGEVIEGFLLEEAIEDINLLIDDSSFKPTPPDRTRDRFEFIAYKDSTDAVIDRLSLSRELWSTIYDLGEEFANTETTDNKNPLIEPTYNIVNSFGRGIAPHIPSIGVEDIQYGFDINPRIVLGFGNVVQLGSITYTDWDDPLTSLIPTASMHIPFPIGTTHNDAASDRAISHDNLVYEVNSEVLISVPFPNLFHHVYQKDILDKLNNMNINALVELSRNALKKIDFRKRYCFNYLGKLVVARMLKVSDYHYCSNLLTPIDFTPVLQRDPDCECILVSTDSVFVKEAEIDYDHGIEFAIFDATGNANTFFQKVFDDCVDQGHTAIITVNQGGTIYKSIIVDSTYSGGTTSRFDNISLENDKCEFNLETEDFHIGQGSEKVEVTITAQCYELKTI